MKEWHFMLPYLPPGINSQYTHTARGRMVLTAGAMDSRQDIGKVCLANGFKADITKTYEISIIWTFPNRGHDIDGPIKGLLDSLFARVNNKGKVLWGATDYTVVKLVVEKRVVSGKSSAEIWIRERE